ncbi:MAG: DUF1580 domain-containing protein [Isosphaeraceae bacterium]
MNPLTAETLIPLGEVPDHVPRPEGAPRVNASTVWRWRKTGVRGATLETVAVGGRVYTSAEALARFIEAARR